jgi:hypothetical protein
MMMSLKTKYTIILILSFLGFAILFAMAPTITGWIIHKDVPIINHCNNTTNYNHCITCCEEQTNKIYDARLYGTGQWSEKYNECWNKNCANLAKIY